MPLLHRYLGNPVLTRSAAIFSVVRAAILIAVCVALIATAIWRSTCRRRGWNFASEWW